MATNEEIVRAAYRTAEGDVLDLARADGPIEITGTAALLKEISGRMPWRLRVPLRGSSPSASSRNPETSNRQAGIGAACECKFNRPEVL